jgi:hypothetical protein
MVIEFGLKKLLPLPPPLPPRSLLCCPKGLLPRHILRVEAVPIRHAALVLLGELGFICARSWRLWSCRDCRLGGGVRNLASSQD